MPTAVPREPTVAALAEVWASLDDLLAALDDDQWSAPTSLPGWDVKAVVAHVIGTESMLLGEQPPDVAIDEISHPHVRNDIGRFNERWVAALAGEPPAAVLERFRDRVGMRLDALARTTADEWDAVTFTPAGQDTYGRFMRIRVFDCWIHEQDIRDAVGRPGGDAGEAARLTLDEMAAALGFLVGKRAGAPPGSRVRFDLTGAAARRLLVEVGERAALVGALSGPPTVTLTMPVGTFVRLGAGRGDPAALGEQVTIEGDRDLGARIVGTMRYTI